MENELLCPICQSKYDTLPDNCTKCNYPFSGTDKEKSIFVGQQVLKKSTVKGTKDKIKRARIILWVIGGLNIIASPFIYDELYVLIVGIIIGIVFIGFGFLTYKSPFISILIPLILLILLYTIGTIDDPSTFFHGILWKILFLSGLVYALIGIGEAENIKKESNFLKGQDYK